MWMENSDIMLFCGDFTERRDFVGELSSAKPRCMELKHHTWNVKEEAPPLLAEQLESMI